MSEFKPYKPAFKESAIKVTKSSLLTSLKEAKRLIKKIKEDDAKDIEKVADALDTVITDAIEDLGSGSAVVSDLIDAAKDLEFAQDADEEILINEEEESDDEDEEEDLEEAEDDDEKEDDEEEMKEEEGDDEKDDEEKDSKEDDKEEKKESYRSYKKRFK